MTLAETLADFITGPAGQDLPADVLGRGAMHVLHLTAVALGGSKADSSQPMLRVIRAAAGTPEATVYGVGRITSATDAALANGTLAHALELDDDHRTGTLAEPHFALDLDRVRVAITSRTQLVFLTRPNNPTSTLIPLAALEQALEMAVGIPFGGSCRPTRLAPAHFRTQPVQRNVTTRDSLHSEESRGVSSHDHPLLVV